MNSIWLILISFLIVRNRTIIGNKIDQSDQLQCTIPKGLSYLTPCYCDDHCEIYHDCCHHFFNAPRLFSCMNLGELSTSLEETAYVFDRCPPGTSAALKQRCEQPVMKSEGLNRTVVITGNDGRLFRNVHCAICHRVNFEEPNLKLKCRTEISNTEAQNITDEKPIQLQKTKSKYDCSVENKIAENNIRLCERNVVTKCPARWRDGTSSNLTANFSDVGAKCMEEPTHYVKCNAHSKPFRNPNCATCNLPTGKCVYSLTGGRLQPRPPRPQNFYTYSVLTNFRRLVPSPEGPSSQDPSSTDVPSPNSTEKHVPLWRKVTSYLTFTFCILSALGLALLLGVLSSVPALRNFGGVLTISIASSLLVGLLCFLIGLHITNFSWACRAVAVVMYYAYLSSFAWMSLFAINVLETLSTSVVKAKHNVGKRYGKFAVFGWLLSLLVTVSAVMIDEVWPESTVSPLFGRGQCYFNNKFGLLSWFYVPVSVAVVANILIGGVVICIIWRTQKQTQRVRNDSSHKQLILLSFKVTAIFGLTWILGLSSALIDNEIFRETAGLVNSLQGVFITLSFLLSSRNITQIQSRFSSETP